MADRREGRLAWQLSFGKAFSLTSVSLSPRLIGMLGNVCFAAQLVLHNSWFKGYIAHVSNSLFFHSHVFTFKQYIRFSLYLKYLKISNLKLFIYDENICPNQRILIIYLSVYLFWHIITIIFTETSHILKTPCVYVCVCVRESVYVCVRESAYVCVFICLWMYVCRWIFPIWKYSKP